MGPATHRSTETARHAYGKRAHARRRHGAARGGGSRRSGSVAATGAALVTALLAGACSGEGAGAAGVPFETAPDEARVDTAEPVFSNPTSITNPLFPVSGVTQVIQLGEEEGKAARVEITPLPETRRIRWNGRYVETRVSQFVAYREGRIVEATVDFFAQDDAGNVWYFGEEVDNYKGGAVANHSGSWLAGKDGPAGMIMPAKPRIGNVWRPENIPGRVFEEVTAREVDETVDGPRGAVGGAIVVEEHLMEGSREHKVFAPGYGEFRAQAEDELVTLALAVPTDARPGAVPSELATLAKGAVDAFEATPTSPSGDWEAVSAAVAPMAPAWQKLRAVGLPPLLEEQAEGALDDLVRAVHSHKPADVRSAAAGVLEAELDLELLWRPVPEVDLGRLAVWARRVVADGQAGNEAGVASDAAGADLVLRRVRHTLQATDAAALESGLRELRRAVKDGSTAAASRAGAGLLRTVGGMSPAGR